MYWLHLEALQEAVEVVEVHHQTQEAAAAAEVVERAYLILRSASGVVLHSYESLHFSGVDPAERYSMCVIEERTALKGGIADPRRLCWLERWCLSKRRQLKAAEFRCRPRAAIQILSVSSYPRKLSNSCGIDGRQVPYTPSDPKFWRPGRRCHNSMCRDSKAAV